MSGAASLLWVMLQALNLGTRHDPAGWRALPRCGGDDAGTQDGEITVCGRRDRPQPRLSGPEREEFETDPPRAVLHLPGGAVAGTDSDQGRLGELQVKARVTIPF